MLRMAEHTLYLKNGWCINNVLKEIVVNFILYNFYLMQIALNP